MKWTIPIVCVVGAVVIAFGANIGVWYGKSKQPVVVEELVEISEPIPTSIIPEPVVEKDPDAFPHEPDLLDRDSLTQKEIADLPYDERPLEASWYETYADILEDPTGYRRGVDYTPVIPYILKAIEKGYLVNGDWKIIKVEINKAEAIPEKKRIDEAMRKAKKKIREALK